MLRFFPAADVSTVPTTLPPPPDTLPEGIRFTDLHAAASVCTPSRAGLLTGRHGLRTGIAGNFGPDSLYGLAETELTIADILKPAGYQSHMIGKVRTALGLCGVGFRLVLRRLTFIHTNPVL